MTTSFPYRHIYYPSVPHPLASGKPSKLEHLCHWIRRPNVPAFDNTWAAETARIQQLKRDEDEEEFTSRHRIEGARS